MGDIRGLSQHHSRYTFAVPFEEREKMSIAETWQHAKTSIAMGLYGADVASLKAPCQWAYAAWLAGLCPKDSNWSSSPLASTRFANYLSRLNPFVPTTMSDQDTRDMGLCIASYKHRVHRSMTPYMQNYMFKVGTITFTPKSHVATAWTSTIQCGSLSMFYSGHCSESAVVKDLSLKDGMMKGTLYWSTGYRWNCMANVEYDQTPEVPFESVENLSQAWKDCLERKMPMAEPHPTIQLTDAQRSTLAFFRERTDKSLLTELSVPIQPQTLFGGQKGTPLLWVGPYYFQNASTRIGGGIIANDAGTGKTLSVLLCAIDNKAKTSLIIVPHNLLDQWSDEVTKWHVQDQVRCITCKKDWKKDPKMAQHKVIITSGLVMRYCGGMLGRRHWDHRFMDEAHLKTSLKVATQYQIKFRNFWPVTATPLDALSAFSEMYKIPRTIERQLIRLSCVRHALKITSKHEIKMIYCKQGDKERAFWSQVKALVKETSPRYNCVDYGKLFKLLLSCTSGVVQDSDTMLKLIKKALGFKIQLGHLEDVLPDAKVSPIGDVSDDCCICMSPMRPPVQLGCRHILCRDCLRVLMGGYEPKCPLCRSPVDACFNPQRQKRKNPGDPEEEEEEAEIKAVGRSKLEAVEQELKLKEVGNRSIIIFVRERDMGQLVRKACLAHNRTVAVAAMGSKLTTKQAVKLFKSQAVNTLVLSLRNTAGFDMPEGQETWFVNTDYQTHKLIQGTHRVRRINQKYDTKTRYFVQENGFDEFLWKYRALPGLKGTRAAYCTLRLFWYQDHLIWQFYKNMGITDGTPVVDPKRMCYFNDSRYKLTGCGTWMICERGSRPEWSIEMPFTKYLLRAFTRALPSPPVES